MVLLEYCLIGRGDSMAKLKMGEFVVSNCGEATIITSGVVRFDLTM